MSDVARVADIVFDSADPRRLAEFWGAVLGREARQGPGSYVVLARAEGQLGVVFQQADTPKQAKNRLHLDIAVSDPRAMQQRIEELGGATVPDLMGGGFLVMADPDGNEFCVIPSTGPQIDDQGDAHYLD